MNTSVTSVPAKSAENTLGLAREVLLIEAEAVRALADRINEQFVAVHDQILETTSSGGRVVVTGIGKSGHIGNKIAATLASTGTPSFFMHPAEASHGDLGMITGSDVVIAISYSGESDEILRIYPALKRRGTRIVAMTGKPASTMAREADLHLDVAVEKEACPLELAPTSSSTATLALGDALAMALLHSRGFTSDDFASHHPAGALGRRLLVHVRDVMHQGPELPKVGQGALLTEAIFEMSRKGMGMTAIVDDRDRMLGVFTDGDLRRTWEKHDNLKQLMVADVMTRDPHTIGPDKLATEAVHLMQTQHVSGRLLVTAPDGTLVGALTFNDLLKAGVV